MIAAIAEGHFDLADFFFLLSAIVFTVLFLLILLSVDAPAKLIAVLTPLGLALFAWGWFVL
jgi:hypothetical protein